MIRFDSLENWYKVYKDFGEREIKGMIIGNKYDLPRKVSLEEASKFAKNYNLPYCEISCKLDKNMKKMVISLLENIISHKNYDQLSSSSSSFNNNENHNNKINNDNKSTKLEKNKNDKKSTKEKKKRCC